jgi:hypothetical protein
LSVVFDALGSLLSLDLITLPEDKVYEYDTDAGHEFHGQTDSVSHDEAWRDVSKTTSIITRISLDSPRRRAIGIDLTRCYARQICDGENNRQGGAALKIGLDVVGDPGQDQGVVSVDFSECQLMLFDLLTGY